MYLKYTVSAVIFTIYPTMLHNTTMQSIMHNTSNAVLSGKNVYYVYIINGIGRSISDMQLSQ